MAVSATLSPNYANFLEAKTILEKRRFCGRKLLLSFVYVIIQRTQWNDRKETFQQVSVNQGEERSGIVRFLSTRHPQAIISQKELRSHSFCTVDFHLFCFHLRFFLLFCFVFVFCLSLIFTPSDLRILLSF